MSTNNDFEQTLGTAQHIYVKQVYEGWENLGFETRNKYNIFDESGRRIAHAAEKNTGWLGAIFRHFFKHWRSFEVNIYNDQRVLLYVAKFPFRWFFKTLFIHDSHGKKLGHLQQRFAIFHKRFDIHDARGRKVGRINSPLFRLWTFELKNGGQHLGTISKKWSGVLTELFTDKDNFRIEFSSGLDNNTRVLMLAATLMVDIEYFENNKKTAFDLFD